MTNPLAVHPLFSDHAVLPHGIALPVSGRSLPGQPVKVQLGERQVTGRANASGRWEVVFEPLPPGGPHVMTVSSSTGQVVRRNLMVGEVWLAAGGIGMAQPVSAAQGGTVALRRVDLTRVRVFNQAAVGADHPAQDAAGRWQELVPSKSGEFSALALHFGQTMSAAVDCAVGLIVTAWPGCPLLAWLHGETLRGRPELRRLMLTRHERIASGLPRGDNGSARVEWSPASAFNGMIAPLTRFPVNGVVWHQGEVCAAGPSDHGWALQALIQGWRTAWERADLPFLFVQLPGSRGGGDEHCSLLREAQSKVSSLPFTAMVVAADALDASKEKGGADVRTVAERLVLAALALTRGRSLPWNAPLPLGAETCDGAITVRFAERVSGPEAKVTVPAGAFLVAGSDRRFLPAEASLEGDRVRVSHPSIRNPLAVRYGWGAVPELVLRTASGVPVAPFRTDDWQSGAE
ncbi:sialate O-acetylesterase [Opitutales bacterium ASA1]|uniref:sialate O-acetylesterase n=1 Tax=Congregicoccus parvus TaxID=3081749 RepID=UPI002B318EE7|nr:sialate O-acetylesterase [Opitutales bacterium ASA1]